MTQHYDNKAETNITEIVRNPDMSENIVPYRAGNGAQVDETKSETANRKEGRHVAHMDAPGGPIDRDGVELEEAGKGHAFDEMWGITKRG